MALVTVPSWGYGVDSSARAFVLVQFLFVGELLVASWAGVWVICALYNVGGELLLTNQNETVLTSAGVTEAE